MALPQYDFKSAFQAVIDWVKGKFVTHENMIEGAIGGTLELEQMIVDEIEPKLDGIEADVAALANKQDKIKIVTTIPTTYSTSEDPEGTIYLVVEGQDEA